MVPSAYRVSSSLETDGVRRKQGQVVLVGHVYSWRCTCLGGSASTVVVMHSVDNDGTGHVRGVEEGSACGEENGAVCVPCPMA